VQLHVGDCIAGMKWLGWDAADVVVTSPPFNIGVKYGRYRDKLPEEQYLAWLDEWACHVQGVLKVDGSLFLNMGGSLKNPLLPMKVAEVVSRRLVLQNVIHWVKSVTVETRAGKQLSVGHFKPISSPRYLNDCAEYLFHFTKTGRTPLDRKAVGVPYVDPSNVKRWKHTGGVNRRCRGNVLFLPYQTVQKRKTHPATFPPELAEYCIKLHGLVSEQTVVDTFVGEGSSAVAAVRCGVKRFIGWDVDGDYIAEAEKRVAGCTGGPIAFLATDSHG
jgi:site-specific DNA-methyltransferase (adenine-specific)